MLARKDIQANGNLLSIKHALGVNFRRAVVSVTINYIAMHIACKR